MSFDDLTADRALAEQLRRSLQRGRLAHAYLFAGPRGSGREALARTLAQALNCERATHDACGQCDSCRLIEKGEHPDIYWVRPESKSRRILIEQIREFETAVSLKPTQARVKVGIVMDADCMNEAASNAFLKTLEEPPAGTIIILLTTDPQQLLPTILSRCLRLSFGPPAGAPSAWRDSVRPLLAEFASSQPAGVVAVYRLHAGLTAQLAAARASIRQRIEDEDDLDRYSELDPKAREKLEEQREARIEGEYRGVREQVLEELYTWFSDIVLCVEGAAPVLLAHPDQLEQVRRAAAGLTYAQATGDLEAVEQVRDALARNVNESFALEVGLLKLAATA